MDAGPQGSLLDEPLPEVKDIELWPFQQEAVEQLRHNLRKGIRRQLLCSPTGSGKTHVALHIIQEAIRKKSKTYFIADRQALVNQTSQRFDEYGIDHGILMGKEHSRAIWKPNLVCSAQTIGKWGWNWRAPEDMGGWIRPDPDLVFPDEADVVYEKVIEHLKAQDIPTMALTATPFGKRLGNIYETVVNVATVNDLLVQGYLCPMKVVGATKDEAEVNVDGLRLNSAGEWYREEVGERVMAIVKDVVPEWEKRTKEYFGGPVQTIVFSPSVDDCEQIAENFQRAGYDFRVVSYRNTKRYPNGETDNQRILNRYREGKHMGVVSCAMVSRGFDAPNTKCIVDTYALRRSFRELMQRYGRLFRIAPGKEYGLLICLCGNWLGFADETMRFFAEGCTELETGRREKVTRKKPEKTEHARCRECGTMLTPDDDTCPSCGASRRRRKRGNLVVRSKETGEIAVVDGKGKPLAWGKDPDEWWPEICAIACKLAPDDYDRQRKIAWAKYKDIFDAWPKENFQQVWRDPRPEVEKEVNKRYRRYMAIQRRKK